MSSLCLPGPCSPGPSLPGQHSDSNCLSGSGLGSVYLCGVCLASGFLGMALWFSSVRPLVVLARPILESPGSQYLAWENQSWLHITRLSPVCLHLFCLWPLYPARVSESVVRQSLFLSRPGLSGICLSGPNLGGTFSPSCGTWTLWRLGGIPAAALPGTRALWNFNIVVREWGPDRRA